MASRWQAASGTFWTTEVRWTCALGCQKGPEGLLCLWVKYHDVVPVYSDDKLQVRMLSKPPLFRKRYCHCHNAKMSVSVIVIISRSSEVRPMSFAIGIMVTDSLPLETAY